mgnify:FL=1
MESRLKKIIIAMIIIVVIIILIILGFLKNMKNNNIQNQVSVGDAGEEVDYSKTDLQIVTEKIDYYTIRNCINNYLNAINKQSSIYYIANEYVEDMQIENVYNLLSSEYIDKNNITKKNLSDKIKLINEEEILVPLKMRVLEKENVNKYIVYGIIQTIDNKYVDDLYMIVNQDYKNKTYSIEPIDEEYDNIDEIKITNENKSIEQNDSNVYVNQKITNEYVTNEYFILYKKLALSKPEVIYNLMSNEYKNSRFGSLEKFKEYISENQEEISKIRLSQYLVNNYDDYIEYVAKDQFENLYIFNESKDESIDIKLDTYSIATEKFKETYNDATDEEKVQMNIDKFFQMINRHDYKNSYNCISGNFKNNYFSTEEKFKEYAKQNFFEYNKLEFKNCEKKGANLYVVKLELNDITGENTEAKEINIIIKLNEELNFEIAFNV